MKKQYSLKFDKQVEAVTGWAKMYYCFDDLDRYDSQMLLNYLIDTESTWRISSSDEGYEDYYQCTNSYITDRLGYISSDILKSMFDDLEKHDYVFIHHHHNNKGVRYVKLNYVKIKFALGIDDSSDQGTGQSYEQCSNQCTEQCSEYRSNYRSEKSGTIHNNKITENQNNDNNIFQKNCTSSKNEDILQYIDNSSCRDILLKWYINIGKKHKISLEQLQDKYQDLEMQCRQDPWMIERSIKNAYLGNYFNFIKPENYNPQDSLHTDVLDTEVRLSKEAF